MAFSYGSNYCWVAGNLALVEKVVQVFFFLHQPENVKPMQTCMTFHTQVKTALTTQVKLISQLYIKKRLTFSQMHKTTL